MFVLLFASGFLTGFLAGFFGIGGGIVLIPILLFIFPKIGIRESVCVHIAFGTALSVYILTSFFAAFTHLKRGNVNIGHVGVLIITGIFGTIFGSAFACKTAGSTLKSLFGILEIVVGLRMMKEAKLSLKYKISSQKRALLITGFASGFISSFLGIGGGILAVPMMNILADIPIHLAIGNSSAFISAMAFSGALNYVYHGFSNPDLPKYALGYVHIPTWILVTLSGMIASNIGARAATVTEPKNLRKAFGILLLIVGLKMIWR